MTAAPRLFCIPATAAPIVAVLRRGPSDWYHVGRWNIDERTYEAGAWIHARIYEQKCDLSPDGRWLLCSILDGSANWSAGSVYEAVSRLPWLHALAAWEAGTTYTRGMHFTSDIGKSTAGSPDIGDATPLLARYGLAITRAAQFAVERRRGWRETDDSPERDARDMWDERRTARMCKSQPNGAATLEVEGTWAAFRDSPQLRDPARYSLRKGTRRDALEDAQWADWDRHGRLLVATIDGRLQIRNLEGDALPIEFEYDLAPLSPDPAPAPEWAHGW